MWNAHPCDGVEMQTVLLDPNDIPLISSEIVIVAGLVLATIVAVFVGRRHARLADGGWQLIVLGLVFLVAHGVFDVLDTLQLDDFTVNLLNLADGTTFVLGLLLFAVGIYQIAEMGAGEWGV